MSRGPFPSPNGPLTASRAFSLQPVPSRSHSGRVDRGRGFGLGAQALRRLRGRAIETAPQPLGEAGRRGEIHLYCAADDCGDIEIADRESVAEQIGVIT